MCRMSFELSREHEEFRRSVREFAEAEIAPHAAQWDRDHHFPVDVVQKMGKLGLIGLTAPEEYGGAGEDGDFTSLCVAIEEIGRVDQSMGITLEAAVGLGINPILTYGTDEQKQTWLPDLVAGQHPGRLRPDRARRRLRRRRHAAPRPSSSTASGWSTAPSSSSPTPAPRSPRCVDRDRAHRASGAGRQARDLRRSSSPPARPGFTAEKPYDKLGWHASDTHPLTFEDCRVPEANLLGERGRGYAQFLATLDDGRVAIAALAVGCIQACLDLSVPVRRRAADVRRTDRAQAGARLPDRRPRGDAATRAALLTYQAAAMKDAIMRGGGPTASEFKQAAAVAKLYATESAVTATRIATQVFGGYGFMEEYPVARFYRDAKVLEIGEGTSEVQRMLIARGLGLPVE